MKMAAQDCRPPEARVNWAAAAAAAATTTAAAAATTKTTTAAAAAPASANPLSLSTPAAV